MSEGPSSKQDRPPQLELESNLQKLMRERGIGPIELARKSKVARQTIQNWMSGQSPQDLRSLKRMAEVLFVTIDELCFSVDARRFLATPLGSPITAELDQSQKPMRLEFTIRRL